MTYLYEDIVLSNKAKKEIKKLYEKAEKLNDEFTTTLLVNKYDMISIFGKDLSGLPQVTKESTDKAFEEIYEFIKKINPEADEYIISQRNAAIEKMLKKPRNRLYGSKSFRSCFKKTENGVYFSMRTFLYKTRTGIVQMIAIV